ncbi:MAG TPA: PLD nuclease N-terminal domain-containing protein [Micromonosporaceae bacterium]|jgi:hypothetical protein|nr:PLD nuclease N-terminal domain-containing protein [Micromonosporaceae bacterium]
MGRLFPFFFLIDMALVVIALIDCLSAEDGAIRALPRVAWVFIILLFSPVGPIAWLVAGRPVSTGPRAGVWAPGNGFPEAQRPVRRSSPDDDPDFLRTLRKQQREDAELLQRWEEDLRRREEELRRRDEDGDG